MDFLLTISGDICFEEVPESHTALKISFPITNHQTLKIKFYAENIYQNNKSNNNLKISIPIYSPSFDKDIVMTTPKELYEQNIELRLRTPIGNMLSYPELGSYVEKYKHDFIDTCLNKHSLQDEVKRALKDIIPKAEVSMIMKKHHYYGYTNIISTEVYDPDKDNYYEYKV